MDELTKSGKVSPFNVLGQCHVATFEQRTELISQLHDWWQSVQSPEVGYSWSGEARTERRLG